jgi:hypothetical protein
MFIAPGSKEEFGFSNMTDVLDAMGENHIFPEFRG